MISPSFLDSNAVYDNMKFISKSNIVFLVIYLAKIKVSNPISVAKFWEGMNFIGL